VEHRSHNAEIVGHYVVTNSYVPCVCIQADWYRPHNTNQRTNWTVSGSGEFFSLCMILKENLLFLLELDGLFLTGTEAGELAAQGSESHADQRSSISCSQLHVSQNRRQQPSAQEVVLNASLVPHG